MVTKSQLEDLRGKVGRAREFEKRRLESKKLKKELFRLKNPRLAAVAEGTYKGASRAVKGLQTAGGRFVDRYNAQQKSSRKKKKDNFMDFSGGFY